MASYPRTGAPKYPPSRTFPRSSARCWPTGRARHLPRIDPAAPRAATASSSSTTARRSPTGCRTTATCSPATSRTWCRAIRTMRGKRVERRFGWDCHGLPAEVEAERLLGISGKADILAMGIEKFNEACRESVLRYTSEWQDYVTRQARWVDFDNDYKTLDLPYMESVMWAFKQLWDKGLVYQGFKVLPYCWRCETPLSNHELRMDDDVYPSGQDPAVTVRFKLETGEWLLAWTTTPWTLPSNLAVRGRPRTSATVVVDEGRRAVHPGRGPAGRLRARAGETPPMVGTLTGRRAGRAALRAAVRLPRRRRQVRHPGCVPGDPVRRRDHRGRHRRGAHGARLRRGRRRWPATRPASRPCSPVDDQGRFTCRGAATSRASTSSTRTPASSARLPRARAAWSGRRPTRTPTRTAGGAATR